MKGKLGLLSEKGAAELSAVNEVDAELLHRGDGVPPIVGLGGSAGGIAALQEFFAAMPVDSGMAFVVILHLSPHHVSTLAEMFQRSTQMLVVAATDGARVEPNSVYVIPPGKFLGVAKGHLRLTNAEEHRGKRVAVDYFFRTLAETHGAQSLGVVLSGAGGDGALGLKRVKELGGLTIAQDPDEAEHPEMPRSAIAAGVVDWVLGVEEMPARLLAYVRQRGELNLPREDGPHPAAAVELSPDEHEAALRDVLAFLHTRTGRDFSCYKRATIVRRIARRTQVNGLADLPSYLAFLRTHAGEAGALLQDLLISVTNFFRDPAAFAALERTIPELFKGKAAGDTVRVWVAGCATGEEAYSIAMLLSEHASTLVGPPQLQVFATDLDEEIIREAREGIYPETIAADVSDERLRHFFIHEQGGYRVRRAVRELVLFAPHDLLKDSPFSRLDLVSCRNLLIYLNREAQSRAFDIFHFALRPGGRLFLGTSEAVDEGSPLFAVLDKKERLYVQRPGPQRLIAVPAGPGTLARALTQQERTRERPAVPGRVTVERVQTVRDHAVSLDAGLTSAELHYRLLERLSPPSILVNSAHEIVHLSESAGRYLQFSGGEPTRNLLRTVLPMLRVELRAALYAAAQTTTATTAFRVPVEVGETRSLVNIRVTPAGDVAPDFLLVVFEEHPADEAAGVDTPRSADADHAALHLERELVATKAHLRDTIEESEASTEELKASNEELQAINEELRSATEELETSREELQSINEELTRVNDELKSNVEQLARSNSDLQNLMAATDIATVFLDRELRIKRFTPSAKTLFNLISTDIGRPLSDLSHQLDYSEIVADADHSLANLQPAQREVSAGERWYIARTVPYRTADDHIAGVVLSFLDITAQKGVEQRLVESEARYRAIGESIDYGVWVCDPSGRNTYASESFLRLVGVTQQQCSDFGWGEALHPDDAESTIAAWKECVRTNGRWDRVHRFKGVDGQWHHVLARGVPLRDATGRVLGWAGLNLDITRMMAAEQEIVRIAAESERQRRLYETVLTNTPDFVYVFSLDHKVLYANDALIEMWGRGAAGAIGKTFLEIGYEPWHAEMHDREIDEVRATRQPIRGEVPFNGTSGRREYDYIFVPIIGADGEVEAVAGTTRDVTERKETERQLREGQEQLDFALAAADLGQWSLNLADHKARRTLRHDQLFGYDALLPEWTYEMFLEHVVPDDRATVDAGFQKAVATGSAWAVECRIRRADGAVRHIWTKALIRRDTEGRVGWMLGIVGDVTDRRQAEERQAFVVRLADTLRSFSDPIRVQSEASRVLGEHLGANRVVYFEIRGDEYVIERDYTAGVRPLAGRYPVSAFGPALLAVLLEGRTVIETDATTEPDRPESERAAFAAIQVRGHVDVPLVKGGRFVAGMTVHVSDRREWTRHEVALIEDTAERTWAAVERVRAEAALRDADRRKDEFLATLAHELRNPLAPIRTGLEVIRMAGATGRMEQARTMMERQLTQLIRLVDDLLDVSRVTSGKLQLRRERVELRAVIEAAVETSRPAIERAGHELTVVVPDEPILLDGDMTRLAQVVSNLLNNSAKYTPRGGHIRLSVQREDDMAVLVVADDGIGIPHPMLGKVFEMFTQVDRALEKTTGGLGIGLSLVKGIVEMHGGTSEARSEGEGRGSEFIVRLPVVRSVKEKVELEQAADKPVGGSSRRRILVTDDNVDSAESLRILLELIGNDVSTANDGLQALDIAETFRPDVILLDIGMPNLNGYEACRRIREQPWGKRTVLIAMTGWGQDEDKRRSQAAGFDHHLVKPVDLELLAKLLASLKPETT